MVKKIIELKNTGNEIAAESKLIELKNISSDIISLLEIIEEKTQIQSFSFFLL